LKYQLAGAQMPPDIRVGYAAGCHGEQTQGENQDEHLAGLQVASHVGRWQEQRL
jgi:hypothetical protein